MLHRVLEMEDKHIADYFVVVGLPENPLPTEELTNETVLKTTHKQDPIVDIAVINRSFGEVAPSKFKCIEFTPSGFPADLNHGSIRAPEMYLCYRRGREKPPIVDIGVLYDGKDTKERVLTGCEVLYNTVQGRSANVNNSSGTRIFITYRRASSTAACDTLAVTDICVILLNKGETAPHAYHTINKTLNKGMMGSDVYLCYKKSMTKTNVLAYKPAVLSRYPSDDISGLPLVDRVAMFCLPLGATIECWPSNTRQPLPIFSTFILTAASGEKVYGAAVTFYELMARSRLDEMQQRHLGLLDCRSSSSSSTDEMKDDAMTIHQNKCICLLSRWPFFETFKKFLGYLYKMSCSTEPHLIPLERYIAHFLLEVPFPSPQRPRILIQLASTELTLSQPDETPLPKSGASFIEFLKNLGPTNCITILLCTLMEQKLLIHSLRPAVLTSVAEAVANMIFPFHWQCPYIPLCPLTLSYVLNSPTPFIVGIDSRYFDLYDPPTDVTCVDLDTNTLTLSDDRKGQTLKMLPKKAVKVLKLTLEKLFEQLHENPSLMNASGQEWMDNEDADLDFSGYKKEVQMETAIREAFLRFMAILLKGYNGFLLPIIKAPTLVTTDVSNLFDIQGFLKSRDRSYHKFYSVMMRTQAFSRFIEERSFVSDKDTSLAFFDECVEKVDETKEDVKLIEYDDSLQSERTVFIAPPESTGLPDGVEYIYNGFPASLDPALFPIISTVVSSQTVVGLKMSSNLDPLGVCSPMTRRTKHELKSAQKIAMKHSNIPKMWANCLVWHCYSLWFIHLPIYMRTVHSKTKALRTAYDVLAKAQLERLQPPDEVCYRVMMQLCGLYHQPALAVKVLFEMKRNGVQPNAVTYGFYNKAVLESKWPTSETRGYQLWTLLRHVILAVAQFKRSWHQRRHSVYSNSESDLDVQSMDSFLESELAGMTIIKDVKIKMGKRSRTGSETGPSQSSVAIEERLSTGLSDRGYSSSTFDEGGKRISIVMGSQNSLDSANHQRATLTNGNPSIATKIFPANGSAKKVEGEAVTPSDDRSSSGIVSTPSFSCDTVASSTSIQDEEMNSNCLSSGSDDASSTKDVDKDNSTVAINTSAVAMNDSSVAMDTSSVALDTTLTALIENSSPLSCNNSNISNVSDKTILDSSINQSQLIDSLTVGYCPDETEEEEEEEKGSVETSLSHHRLLIPVTENDPLGVFVLPTTSVTKATVAVPPSALLSTDVQPFSTTSDEVASNDDLSSANSPDSLRSSTTVESEQYLEDADLKTKSVNRGDIFGSAVRSAATRLFSKYNDLRKSMVTQGGSKTDSGSMNSINSLGIESGGGGVIGVVGGGTGVAGRGEDVNSTGECDSTDHVSTDSSEVTISVSSEVNPLKSRLRVPGLYAPLMSGLLGGLKTLHSSETLQGIATSFQQMKTTVQVRMKEGWNSVDGKEEEEEEMIGLGDEEGKRVGGAAEEDVDEESIRELKGRASHDLDHLVPVEESSDRGSMTGDQSSFRYSAGSMLSLPQSSSPVEVEMCTLSKCHSCGNLLYDEEIMAGWTSDDSNLNTSCQFCGVGLVPLIHIYIKDFRHSIKSPISNLSQSIESMLSDGSMSHRTQLRPIDRVAPSGDDMTPSGEDVAPSGDDLVPFGEDLAPSGDDGLKDDGIVDIAVNNKGRQESLHYSHVDNSINPDEVTCSAIDDNRDVEVTDGVHTDEEIIEAVQHEDIHRLNDRMSKRTRKNDMKWRSKDLELGSSYINGLRRKRGRTDSFKNRRCTSECSLEIINRVTSDESSQKNEDGSCIEKMPSEEASIVSNASDDKNTNCVRKCIELEPITVPYLSPLVLRKELENVLDQDGDLCLAQTEFVDQHPILFWNVVWYFKRLDVPSHMPGFILTAKSLNKIPLPSSSVWASNNSRYVAIFCMWDNLRLHQDHGPPLYILWNQPQNSHSSVVNSDLPDMFNKSLMVTILTHIKNNDVVSPLRLILKERNKRRMQTNKTRFHSIYRDLLFLSFTALGRENIDHEAFDREFRNMFIELPAQDSARLRIADRTPNSTAIWCRKMFHELQLGMSS